jgi:hypothetical protein
MPNADARRDLPRRRNSGSPTSENSENANFFELRYGELRRIPIMSTSSAKLRLIGFPRSSLRELLRREAVLPIVRVVPV